MEEKMCQKCNGKTFRILEDERNDQFLECKNCKTKYAVCIMSEITKK